MAGQQRGYECSEGERGERGTLIRGGGRVIQKKEEGGKIMIKMSKKVLRNHTIGSVVEAHIPRHYPIAL